MNDVFITRLADAKKKEDSQKIDDWLVLVTCRYSTSAIISSKVNGPVAHGSTR